MKSEGHKNLREEQIKTIDLACFNYTLSQRGTDPLVIRERSIARDEYHFQCCGCRHNDYLYGEVFVNSKGEIRIIAGSDSRFKENFERFLDQNTASK